MKIDVIPLAIPGAFKIRPGRVGDARGWFSELFNKNEFARQGVNFAPVQENVAFSAELNIVRGLHAQRPPFAQAKLVRAARGRIFDVLVDARTGSPAYGAWTGTELSADALEQLFIPPGCLHGYATRERDCEVVYLVDAPYDPGSEVCVRWNDPALGVDWGIAEDAAVLSPKDSAAPRWAAFESPFAFA